MRVLKRRGESSEFIEKLFEVESARHPMKPADRGLCQEIIYGVIRWQAALDWLIARKTANRPQDPLLRLLLQTGLYQLIWLERIPPHAAVHETVELCKQFGLPYQSGFVNAILRGYAREREDVLIALDNLKQSDPATGFSHPAWLMERWRARWGAATAGALMQWNNTPPPIYARMNSLKTNFATLTAEWDAEKVDFAEKKWDWTERTPVFELISHPPLPVCPSFQAGFFYVQDPSTLLAVQELDARPEETILDMCAAPGGKTTYMAQRMENRGRIVALDIDPARQDLVKQNCERLGVTCVEFSLPAGELFFDKILIDAPCSNTGVLRRRVDLRWRLRMEEVLRLRQTQLELLHQAAPLAKAGGIIIYSTCSLEPEENESVMDEFLKAHPAFKLEAQRQLTPFADGVDGAFVARLRKTG